MQKSTSRSCHTRSCLSFISEILTAQCTYATLTSTLFLSSTIGGASVIFLKQNLFLPIDGLTVWRHHRSQGLEGLRHVKCNLTCVQNTVEQFCKSKFSAICTVLGRVCECSTDLQRECSHVLSSIVHLTLTRRREHNVLRHGSFQSDCVESRWRFVWRRKQSLITHCEYFHNRSSVVSN